MSEIPDEGNITEELRKLANIATDMQLDSKMRTQAIKQLRDIGSHEALLIMLNLAANDKLNVEERDLALKKAREIVKKSR